MPFGLGSNMCPGRKFARQEVKLLVIKLLTHYKISFDKTQDKPEMEWKRLGLGVFPPASDIKVEFKRL